MNKLYFVASFVLGAAIGSFVTWNVVKDTYQKLAQEEIEDIRQYYKEKLDALEPKTVSNEVPKNTHEKPDIREFAARIIGENGYKNYSNTTIKPDPVLNEEEETEQKENEVVEHDPNKPYVISPEEFGEKGYTVISLSYYADGVLADEDDHVVEDVDAVIGYESLEHFGEYENDSVHVRNDRLRCDYEILIDLREYSEVISAKPYLTEEE